MQLVHARIQNFRSLKDVSVDFGVHTALIGGNGAGKSSILKALERFYSTTKSLDADDFFGRDQSVSVEIELTFGDLTPAEQDFFSSRVRDGKLTVTRVFDTGSNSGRYFGAVLQNRDFLPIRSQSQAGPKRDAYKALRTDNPTYAGLPAASSATAVDEALAEWERTNPAALTLERDDGQFFGFQNASRGALQRYTSFVFVPAVREAAQDAADSKSSPIGKLLEVLVRSSILKRAEVQAFQNEMAARYAQIVAPENMPELGQLADNLTADLKQLYGDAAVGLDWREPAPMPIPLPAADVTLSHDGFGGPVDRQGHGLQRAFVFTLLQHLARASEPLSSEENEEETPADPASVPNLILAVEEPELYQHPTKQRHLAQVLRRLSTAQLPGTSGATQIAFASHSPMFVSLRHSDEIRLVRRTDCEGSNYKQCELRALNLSEVASELEKIQGKPTGTFTAETLKPRLHILGTELAEGFFADGIVLVEGRSDRAALMASAKLMGLDFEASGIAVLSSEGKNSLDRPYLIFRKLGIPIFMIWDCDVGLREYKKSSNLFLNRIVSGNAALVEPDERTVVAETHATFEVNREATLKSSISSELYDECLRTACETYGFDASGDAEKIPDVMHGLLVAARDRGRSCAVMEQLIRAIWLHLKGTEIPPTVSNDAGPARGPTPTATAA